MQIRPTPLAVLPGFCVLSLTGFLTFRALKKRIIRAVAYNVEECLRRESFNLDRERQRMALKQTAEFVEANLASAERFTSRRDLLAYALDSVPAEIRSGPYCEFGVYQGTSLNFIAARVDGPVHGFDSFEGLPSGWRDGHPAGHFRVNGLPPVAKNVTLHKGWFESTLPEFGGGVRSPLAFLHVDCDLYSSTRTVFETLGDLITEGTTVVFDEYFNYPGWTEGEHRALLEFAEATGTRFEYLGYNARSEQVAIRIVAAPAYRGRPAPRLDSEPARSAA